MPAMAICASVVWPPRPVTTTKDRAKTTAIVVVMIAARHSGPKATNPISANTTGSPTFTTVSFDCGTFGRRQVSTAARFGNVSPMNHMAPMMMRNGRPSRAP